MNAANDTSVPEEIALAAVLAESAQLADLCRRLRISLFVARQIVRWADARRARRVGR